MNPHPELVDAFRKAFVFICQNCPMGPTDDRTAAGKLIDELRIPLANATPDFSEQDRNEWSDASLFYAHAHLEAHSYGLPEGSTERGCIREALRKIELADTYIEKRLRENDAAALDDALTNPPAPTEKLKQLMADPPEQREVRCPRCYEQCGWCGDYRHMHGTLKLPGAKQGCSLSLEPEGTDCPLCAGAMRVVAVTQYLSIELAQVPA